MLQPSWKENQKALPLRNLQEYGEHLTNLNAKKNIENAPLHKIAQVVRTNPGDTWDPTSRSIRQCLISIYSCSHKPTTQFNRQIRKTEGRIRNN